jgi:peptide/nickel transport system permease protein
MTSRDSIPQKLEAKGGAVLEKERNFSRFSLWRDAFERLLANKLAIVSAIIVFALIFIAIFGPLITPYDFLSQNISLRYQSPSTSHLLGTDGLGRDILSRIVYGARTATIVAFSVTIVSVILGMVLGSIAGYVGGRVDTFIMWLIDMTLSIPGLLLAVVINVSLKLPATTWMDNMYLATHNSFYRQTYWVDFVLVFGTLAFIQWPGYARLIRGQILTIRNQNYVLAARALGIGTGSIILRYVIPNAIGPIIVSVSAGLGSAMVLESAFSFLGIGVNPPIPSWGNMINDGLTVWNNYPYLLAAPAGVLAIVTIAFSFLGDGLNDALNPRQWK